MDELSPRARALLAKVQDGHDPAPGVSERVWRSVSADIAGSAAVELGRALTQKGALAKKGALAGKSLLMGKVIGVAAVVAATSVGAWVLHTPALRSPDTTAVQQAHHAAPAVPKGAPRSEHDSTSDTPGPANARDHVPAASEAPAAASQPQPGGAAASARKPRGQPRDPLLSEISVLQAASNLLGQQRYQEALTLLGQQQKLFVASALHAEHRALTLLARCGLHETDGVRSARRFLAENPDAVLRTRVEKACQLEREEP